MRTVLPCGVALMMPGTAASLLGGTWWRRGLIAAGFPLSLALLGLTSFTTLPLRIWSMVGAGISLLALAYGLWIAIEALFLGNPLRGWPTLAASIMLFSGVQLLSIGILGEYIGRIYEEVKRRPTYLVARDEDNSPWRDS